MARINSGILGGFSGKIGPIIGSSWKGDFYMKALYKSRVKSTRPKEIANRTKFGEAHRWLQPVTNYVRQGFKGFSPKVEGFLAAKSWMLLNSFTETDGMPVIDPAKVKLSHGSLPIAPDIQVAANGDQLHFTWSIEKMDSQGGHDRDQIMIVACDLKGNKAIYEVNGQFREYGKEVLKDLEFDTTYHVYAAFVAQDRTTQSDSIYLGTVTTDPKPVVS